MSKQHTKETLKFNHFSGYYASFLQGYGGFNWFQMDYLNATYWQNVATDWCDTGFQNVIKGGGEAYTYLTNGTFGEFQSADLQETFTLKSMVAASGWETHQPFTFISYGADLQMKASDTIYLSQTAKTIDFAKIGKPGDFTNIAEVAILPGSGKYGNTCSYGPYGYTLGYVMAFDNVKIVWNGKIPKGDGKLSAGTSGLNHHGHSPHAVIAHALSGNSHPVADTGSHGAGHSGTGGGFHSELMSLGGPNSHGLTDNFQLPIAEHFGT